MWKAVFEEMSGEKMAERFVGVRKKRRTPKS